jgi:hypothetical protein
LKKIRFAILLLAAFVTALMPRLVFGQSAIPTVDGGAGPCSVEFTVTDASGALVSNAQISVHIEYGFLGAKKLDLQVATDTHGKARFVGLPEKPDNGLFFEATKGNLRGVATDDPNTECEAKHGIYMSTRNAAQNAPE